MLCKLNDQMFSEGGGEIERGREKERERESSSISRWPLHDIAIANIVWCTAYTRGSGIGSHIAH